MKRPYFRLMSVCPPGVMFLHFWREIYKIPDLPMNLGRKEIDKTQDD